MEVLYCRDLCELHCVLRELGGGGGPAPSVATPKCFPDVGENKHLFLNQCLKQRERESVQQEVGQLKCHSTNETCQGRYGICSVVFEAEAAGLMRRGEVLIRISCMILFMWLAVTNSDMPASSKATRDGRPGISCEPKNMYAEFFWIDFYGAQRQFIAWTVDLALVS